ncbi:Taurine catabolism dioxygenase TauD/TfdA [Penicillium majusculum]|nr:Taurine catabolism dioxygenase TauD/TfdA [Penicillium majusculum]
MAPGLVEATGLQTLSNPVKLSVFPDGFKISGQHPPIYSLVRPYVGFPKTYTGPTVWKAEDYRENPEL